MVIKIQNVYKKGFGGVRRGWTKWVKDLDATKNNGFALLGDFLNDGDHNLPVGAVLVQKNPEGDGRNSWWSANCYIVVDNGTIKPIAKGLNWKIEFLRFRNIIAQYLDRPKQEFVQDLPKEKILAQFTDEELLAECQRRLSLAEGTMK